MLSKKVFLLTLIVPFLVNGPVEAVENTDSAAVKIEAKRIDQRAEVLHAYLVKYNSPLKYQAQDFIDAADTYALDWKLLPAIAGVESAFGKFIPGGYNAWGWGVYGNQAIYFTSWRQGIFTVSEGLKQNYFSRGLKDPYAINRMYAASSAWGSHVSYFLEDLERFEKKYRSIRQPISPDLIALATTPPTDATIVESKLKSFNLISLDQ